MVSIKRFNDYTNYYEVPPSDPWTGSLVQSHSGMATSTTPLWRTPRIPAPKPLQLAFYPGEDPHTNTTVPASYQLYSKWQDGQHPDSPCILITSSIPSGEMVNTQTVPASYQLYSKWRDGQHPDSPCILPSLFQVARWPTSR
uniref:Uncharacterized protein n=1 Tax=Timema poppense TaxID=170557 RepID=A0A7R9H5B4_TIMPO|nr:unnamed protein product [Timema poppensis]